MSINKLPLVEAARPFYLDDLVLKSEYKNRIIKILDNPESTPHLIFEGAPGTGKTSLARILARELLGNVTEFNYLEVNASSDRGIATIRQTLKKFVSSKGFMKMGAPKTKFKIILLDEACSLTADAQLALRNFMETHVNTARFILSCNDIKKINEALISRCLVFNFEKLDQKKMYLRAKAYLELNKMPFDDKKLEYLCNHARGDFRKVWNNLDSEGIKMEKNETFYETLKTHILSFTETENLKTFDLLKKQYYKLNSNQRSLIIEKTLEILQEQASIKGEFLFFCLERLSKAELAIKVGNADFTLQFFGWISALNLRKKETNYSNR